MTFALFTNVGTAAAPASYFYQLNAGVAPGANGTIRQARRDPGWRLVNQATPYGEQAFTAFLLASGEYYDAAAGTSGAPVNGTNNALWIDKVWHDLFGFSSGATTATIADDDLVATDPTHNNGFLQRLNAGTLSRQQIVERLTGAVGNNGETLSPGAGIPLNPRSALYDANLVASLFNQLLARNYPTYGAGGPEISARSTRSRPTACCAA